MSNENETTGAPENEPNLETHPLVTKLGGQGQAPRDLATLVGYLGPASQEDQVRLYHDLSFRGYYDIPRSEVVHTEPLNAGDENSPTRVLVNASARVAQTQVSTQSGEARFLQGGITSGFLPAAAAPAANVVFCGTLYTAAPTVCAPGAVSILCYQTHLLGCTTATTPPQLMMDGRTTATATPPTTTHLMGCTTVTATPQDNLAAYTMQGPCRTHLYFCPPQAQPAAQAVTVHPTLWTQLNCAPTQLLGCTTVTATPPTTTHLMGCTTVTATPPTTTHLMGCTTVTATPPDNLAAYTMQGPCRTHLYFCPPQAQPAAQAVTTTIHFTTYMPGCTTATTPQANLASPQGAYPNTLATVCTQFNCPTHQFVCPTPTGICTVLPPSVGCPQQEAQAAAAPTGICTVLPPSVGCPTHLNTAATVCTQLCTVQPPVHQNTAATVCTQINCR
ncbi:Hypothetical protein AA314_07417 [Archangium gephyra]|uniref:Uncharacterized protein n=1 Tax=Archangium gephyra TaxID=48 RepID=A0AAC8TIP2_9BACT|nr:hypothetical protein [Archangium gephyra]AKJ05791.1 Hypothetical protein AA314_07417 [Archangium gephyra]